MKNRIEELEQALEWAVAEIEGETQYSFEGQREASLDAARDVLEGKTSPGRKRTREEFFDLVQDAMLAVASGQETTGSAAARVADLAA